MTIKELCKLLPECVRIKISGAFDDVEIPRDDGDFWMECLGDYEIFAIRPHEKDLIHVSLKTQYVKRSN
jgi:hypothetical protein